jgi:hypothetical protein
MAWNSNNSLTSISNIWSFLVVYFTLNKLVLKVACFRSAVAVLTAKRMLDKMYCSKVINIFNRVNYFDCIDETDSG